MRWGRTAATDALLLCLFSTGCGRTWLELLPADVEPASVPELLDAATEDLQEEADADATDDVEPSDPDAEDWPLDAGMDRPVDSGMANPGSVIEAGSDAGGAALVACPAEAPAARSDLLIDDLEDADAWIREAEGRRGAWYTVNDGSRSGHQTPAPDDVFVAAGDGARGSAHAARTWGGGFSGWGAALGVRLHAAAQTSCAYDASLHGGIRFYARGAGTATISVLSAATVPIASGGSCRAGCLDYYATRVVLGASWSLHELRWNELRQTGWGTPARFDPAELFAIEFAFGRGATFDLYVDDLALF